MIRRVTSQAEFDAALAAQDEIEIADDLRLEVGGNARPVISLIGRAILRLVTGGSSRTRIVSRGSSTLNAESWESSTLNAESWGSSTLNAVSRGSSTLNAVSRGSSTLNAESWESSTLNAVSWESSTLNAESRGGIFKLIARSFSQVKVRGAVRVIATATVAIVVLGGAPQIEGGGFVQRVDISTPAKWCDYYGVEVHAGVALLFKGVKADFHSPREFPYLPGTAPVAPDWDGGHQECGRGLHFSPSPSSTLEFVGSEYRAGMHFLVCPVALSDMAVHPDGEYPQKVKARGLAHPCWEVDRRGKPVPGAVVWVPSVDLIAKGRAGEKPAAKKRAKTGARRRGAL